MKSRIRTLLLMLCDAAIINLAMAVPLVLRFYESDAITPYLNSYINLAPWFTLIFIAIFYAFKLYNRVWAYASTGELFAVIQAVTCGTLATIVLTYFAGVRFPRSIVLMHWALTILLMGGSRLSWRYIVERKKN
ncbi:MAG TPA: polysaccharide biosynthesis protein, partial [Bacillota bacterium]|nr:polysaccharide biosynthesis protein [Bacillota bacterium]